MVLVELPGDEGQQGRGAADQAHERDDVGPAPFGALVDAQDQSAHSEGGEHRADDVEATLGVLLGVAHDGQGEPERHEGQGGGGGEDPRPGDVVDDHRAGEEAKDATGAGEAAPDGDGLGLALGRERRGDGREGHRHDEGGPGAGDEAGCEDHGGRRSQRSGQVGPGEHDEAGDEEPLFGPSGRRSLLGAGGARRGRWCSR